ncbi:MAG: 30S ribosomal protein S13 [Candidatus Bathyarchaeota archaeon]|nr:30S ribosomal protein S13 [Candidatus Bathyarchaeota archaeon]MDH5494766.1 30S ribosomal protein S13 [Candidatus Bathyarchaeota archaeon]
MSKEFRHITRIVETDLDGTLKVARAISKIKGIGISMANTIVKKGEINPEIRLGFLSDQDLEKLEDIIENPTKYDLPEWLFNRQKDLETGKNLHLTGSDLVLQTKTDINLLKATKSWKGYRHSYGLKVRGQRTKTTGRKGKAIGVKKKQRPMGAKR